MHSHNGILLSRPTSSIRLLDNGGCGLYCASRTPNRQHNGCDFLAAPSSNVGSPIAGSIIRLCYAYSDTKAYQGVVIGNTLITVQLLYVLPTVVPGSYVHTGAIVGRAQDISQRYPNVPPHIHLRILAADPLALLHLEDEEIDAINDFAPHLRPYVYA